MITQKSALITQWISQRTSKGGYCQSMNIKLKIEHKCFILIRNNNLASDKLLLLN